MEILAALAITVFLLYCIGFWRAASPEGDPDLQRFMVATICKQEPDVPAHPNCRSAATYVSLGNRVWLDKQVREVLDGIPDIDQL